MKCGVAQCRVLILGVVLVAEGAVHRLQMEVALKQTLLSAQFMFALHLFVVAAGFSGLSGLSGFSGFSGHQIEDQKLTLSLLCLTNATLILQCLRT